MDPASLQADPHAGGLNLPFVEELYADFLVDRNAVPDTWARYFDQMAREAGAGSREFRRGPSIPPRSIFNPAGANGSAAHDEDGERAGQERIDQLIRNYRVRGHLLASLDPLGLPKPQVRELEPEHLGFTERDMERKFSTALVGGAQQGTLAQILQRLQNTYCRSIGVQFMHIDSSAVRNWLQERMETVENRIELSRQEQIRILTRLTDATIFESFLAKKYVGAKTFSLEGGESLIPLLDLAIERAAEQGIDDIVMGMAHRGRLNVLANIIGKSPYQIFREFEDDDPELHLGRGDVKYHLGFSNVWHATCGREVHLSLCFNPSHLEYVNPVAMGKCRSRQDRRGDTERERSMVVLVHGDAAFIGEGVVQETLNLSQLPAYRTGGTLHVVVNNQIGFTTGPSQYRSTIYCTDIAKMLQSPIFHVNGEDPEAVAQVVRLAMDFRKTFQRDVVIDVYCYRRRGHNEGDEPSFTQPVMYRAIENRKSVREGYLDHLLKLGGITQEEADAIAEQRRKHLEEHLEWARAKEPPLLPNMTSEDWSHYHAGPASTAGSPDTAVPAERLVSILEATATVPVGFNLHPKLQRMMKMRMEMAQGSRNLNWAAAEAAAFGSLAIDGRWVRLTGQDSQRGTFSHRHAVVHDYETGEAYHTLQHLCPGQAPVDIQNSPLSEAGVLGFEFGYSIDRPDGLVAWEAQFGDFVNAAQVIIDQFVTTAEDKWRRFSGLVMLLPHGFEGQGPEHSSARLERFLMLSAEDNIQVTQPTTPAQYFHMLRRQVLRDWRKPLVVMTPKSLLRHPQAESSLEELASGRFREVIADTQIQPQDVQRIILCSGRVYYDLIKRREEAERTDTIILRIEQLYPFPEMQLTEALAGVADGTPAYWVQDEPENMGAWWFIHARYGKELLGRFPLTGVYRPASSSPATGSHASHELEQRQLLDKALPRM